jgi:hypothetical protein
MCRDRSLTKEAAGGGIKLLRGCGLRPLSNFKLFNLSHFAYLQVLSLFGKVIFIKIENRSQY